MIYKFYCWNNRHGNHLISFINLINFAFYDGNAKSVIVPDHPLFTFTKVNLEKKTQICHSDEVVDVTRRINPCGKLITLELMKEICDKYVTFKHNIPNESKYDICMHIRDGDIFTNLIHFEYVQPPFDYYYQTIKSNPTKKICILYPNGNSPIIPKLKKIISDENITNVEFQSGKLHDDIITMASSKMLLWSFSSFCIIPYMFSKTLKKVVMPESIIKRKRGRPWFSLKEKSEILVVNLPEYILVGYWKNTEQQIEKILNYKLIESEKEKLLLQE